MKQAAPRGLALLATLLPVAVALAPVALALVPAGERVADAIVTRNARAGRTQALRFQLEMRIGEGPVVARGELVTHPSGMARLELRGVGGLVEKHLLQGSVYLASRNERQLLEPRAFLPPLFLLQIDSAQALRSALIAFRIHPDQIGLAPCDESDCYVMGDPDRVAPLPPPPEPPEPKVEADEASSESAEAEGLESALAGMDEELASEELAVLLGPTDDEVGVSGRVDSEFDDLDGYWHTDGDAHSDLGEAAEFEDEPEEAAEIVFPLAPGELPATLWIDMETLDLQRMRLANGARVRFGPYLKFGRVRVPAWLQIEEERGVVRFDVVEVTPVNAPPSAFKASWLVAPATSLGAPLGRPAGSPETPGE